MFGSNYITSIFRNAKNKKTYRQAMKFWNNEAAIFNSFGNDVYMSDFVNNAIDRIATEISKIEIHSVLDNNNSIKSLNDDITRLFKYKPNPLQTTKDFLACCEWIRRKDNNCFIYPQYEIVRGLNGNTHKKYTAFYPLNPTKIEIGVGECEVWEIKFYFKDGSSFILPYDELIHLKWRRGKNTTIGGGDDDANSDTRDLLRSVKTLDKVLQGLPKSIEYSLKINGVYTAKTLMDNDKLTKAKEDFESHIFKSDSGIVATDLSGEFTPIKTTPATIDPVVLKLLKSIVRERYGISEKILSGEYTGEDHAAFYQNCIEDFIIEFQQASSSCLFSNREQNVGHKIKCYYNKVSYLNSKDKIEIANLAKDTGLMELNQIGDMFGMPPFAGGNRRIQSLNYVNVDLIDKYQIAKGGEKNDKETGTEKD